VYPDVADDEETNVTEMPARIAGCGC
jgi:hypothetical protein